MQQQQFDDPKTEPCRAPCWADLLDIVGDDDTIIKRLHRDMENCPPTAVAIAEKALRQQIARNRKLVVKQSVQLDAVKREHWCHVCLMPAEYYCCWYTSYCSVQCQRVHWNGTHQFKCLRSTM